MYANLLMYWSLMVLVVCMQVGMIGVGLHSLTIANKDKDWMFYLFAFVFLVPAQMACVSLYLMEVRI